VTASVTHFKLKPSSLKFTKL